MKKKIYVLLECGIVPNAKTWEKAKNLLLKEIKEVKRPGANMSEYFAFSDFMYCIFFVLAKVGVKEIRNDYYMMDCLQNLYYQKRTKKNGEYTDKMFSFVWSNPGGPGGGYASVAESFCTRLLGSISHWAYGHGNVIKLGESNDLSKNQQRFFDDRFHEACRALTRRKNKKYISIIMPIARDLLEAMRKGEK